MKKYITTLAVLTATSSFAQDLRLGDLNFFPKQGSVLGEAQFIVGESGSKFIDGIEVKDDDYEESDTHIRALALQASYSLRDDLLIGGSFVHKTSTFESTKVVDTGVEQDKNKEYEDSGLSDPSVFVIYRVVNDQYYVDLLGGLTLSFGDKEIGTTSSTESFDGNNLDGYSTLSGGAAIGVKSGIVELRAEGLLELHGEGEGEIKSDPDLEIETRRFAEMSLKGEGQIRPVPDLALSAFVDLARTGERVLKLKDFNAKVTQDSFATVEIGTWAKYNVAENLLVKAGYSYTSPYEYDSKASLSTEKDRQEEEALHQFKVGAEVLF